MAITRGIGGLKDAEVFPAWAYRIVSNKSRNWIGEQQRRRNLADEYSEHILRAQDEVSNSNNQCSTLHEAMQRLSGRDRILLSLYYQEDFTIADIATILNIPEGTVKSRLHYARERLRGMMEGYLDE